MEAHFYDIDTLISGSNSPWIVSKDSPNIPILKISQSDFNLCKKGIYKSHGNKISFNGKTFWLPDHLMNKIKIKSKNSNLDISKLAISMQEFLNREIIDNIKFEINIDLLKGLINKDDHIYIICSKNTKSNYQKVISEFELSLKEIGLVVKDFYYISETFYNRHEDDIAYKKVKLILQHIVGFKTEINKFIDTPVYKYDEIYFYDSDFSSTNLMKSSSDIFQSLLKNTDSVVKLKIKDVIKTCDNIIYINQVTNNQVNRFIKSKSVIEWSNLIKAFENFNRF